MLMENVEGGQVQRPHLCPCPHCFILSALGDTGQSVKYWLGLRMHLHRGQPLLTFCVNGRAQEVSWPKLIFPSDCLLCIVESVKLFFTVEEKCPHTKATFERKNRDVSTGKVTQKQ